MVFYVWDAEYFFLFSQKMEYMFMVPDYFNSALMYGYGTFKKSE